MGGTSLSVCEPNQTCSRPEGCTCIATRIFLSGFCRCEASLVRVERTLLPRHATRCESCRRVAADEPARLRLERLQWRFHLPAASLAVCLAFQSKIRVVASVERRSELHQASLKPSCTRGR